MNVNHINDVGNTVAISSAFFEYPQGAAAAAEIPVGLCGPGFGQVAIGAISLHPAGTLAISGTNYVTVNVYKRTAGGSQTLIGTTTTFTGGTAWAPFTPVALTLQSGAGSFFTPGDSFTMSVVNTGAPTNVAFTIAGFIKAT